MTTPPSPLHPRRPGATLDLGSCRPLDGSGQSTRLLLPAHHLVTHGVIVGMTGSGKTGLLTVLVEEALRAGVPSLVIDVKGDLPNLLWAFPDFDAARYEPFVEGCAGADETRPRAELARELVAARERALAGWGLGAADLAAFAARTSIRVLTPGSSAGEPVHLLSSLEHRSPLWDHDSEAARAALAAAVSLVLRLVGEEPDPAKSRAHVFLSVLAERRLRSGSAAPLGVLLDDLARPPIDTIGALSVDAFLPKAERRALAASLNTLLASPSFESWRSGVPIDVGAWLDPGTADRSVAVGRRQRPVKTPCVILSVAHLDDEERALVLGVVLEEVLAWVRGLRGTQRLRALVAMDEVYGFLPPHPANPPTKRPIVALMKQARAFGVGVVLATQNPMDLDYRALSNAGAWCVGRLQTDADRARVVEALGTARGAGDHGPSARDLDATLKRLAPRWFVLRDAHDPRGPMLMRPREAMTWMRGPMTRAEIVEARGAGVGSGASVADDGSA